MVLGIVCLASGLQTKPCSHWLAHAWSVDSKTLHVINLCLPVQTILMIIYLEIHVCVERSVCISNMLECCKLCMNIYVLAICLRTRVASLHACCGVMDFYAIKNLLPGAIFRNTLGDTQGASVGYRQVLVSLSRLWSHFISLYWECTSPTGQTLPTSTGCLLSGT